MGPLPPALRGKDCPPRPHVLLPDGSRRVRPLPAPFRRKAAAQDRGWAFASTLWCLQSGQ